MKTAFLFPGQGSQFVGMGQDLYAHFPEARARFDAADALLGFALTEKMFGAGGPPDAEADALRQTEVTQPALYVHSMAVLAVLEQQGTRPDMAAGHSLGEYSALVAAGVLSFEDGLKAVQVRGQLMAQAGHVRPGAMAAILGLDDATLEAVCEEVSDETDLVQPANFNSPGQVVISGDVQAVARAMEAMKQRGARRVVPLPVSGAFHSPLMAFARTGLAETLQALPMHPPRCPVYLNVTAQPATDPEDIRTRLLDQLTAPVRWAQSLRHMQSDGATAFLEVGAGSVLCGLVRQTLGREAETARAGTLEDLRTQVNS
jgi:[acyl-carrier-protein] S-malonyltransferase